MKVSKDKKEVDYLIENLKLVTSNKLNSTESRLLMLGVLYEVIQHRGLYPKNADLKLLVNKEINKIINCPEFKDYLFASRTILAARVQKNVMDKADYLDIIQIANFLQENIKVYTHSLEDTKVKKDKNKRLKTDPLQEWMGYISDRNRG